MKKYIWIIISTIISIIIILAACLTNIRPKRIDIIKNRSALNNFSIPLRQNYSFSEDLYSIEETEDGYNIIIHCIKEK